MEQDSFELLVNIQTRGMDALSALASTTKTISQNEREASAATSAFGKSVEGAGSAAQKADVGIGSLLDSARRASDELRKMAASNDTAIRNLERQAQLTTAKTAQAKLEMQRGFALQDMGKSAGDVERINAAYSTMSTSLNGVQESMVATILKSALLVQALTMVVGAAKELTIGSAQYAARTETLGVITQQLARVNHLSAGSVLAHANAVKQLGITTQESLGTVNRMIFAQLDVAKATDVARLAQDAGRIAGQNSSEALQGIIHGIVTRQPEVLRTYGIVVNFEQEYAKAARERGRELVAAEKTQVAMNVVLNEGAKITGVYASTLMTTGGRLQSMQRYIDEAKNAIGESLVPALGTAVSWMTKLAKLAGENSQAFATLTGAISGAGIAYTLLSLLPVGRGVKIGGTIIGGVAGAIAGNTDPVKATLEMAKAGGETLETQRKALNANLEKGLVKSEEYKRQWDQIEENVRSFKEALLTTLAKDLKKKYDGLPWIQTGKDANGKRVDQRGGSDFQTFVAREFGTTDWLGRFKPEQSKDLGHGITLNAADIASTLATQQKPQAGATFNQDRFDAEVKAQLAEQAAEKAKKAHEKLVDYLQQLSEHGLDPFSRLVAAHIAKLQDLKKEGASQKDLGAAEVAFKESIARLQRQDDRVGDKSGLEKLQAERDLAMQALDELGKEGKQFAAVLRGQYDTKGRVEGRKDAAGLQKQLDRAADYDGYLPDDLKKRRGAAGSVLGQLQVALTNPDSKLTLNEVTNQLDAIKRELEDTFLQQDYFKRLNDDSKKFSDELKKKISEDEKKLRELEQQWEVLVAPERGRIEGQIATGRSKTDRQVRLINATTMPGHELDALNKVRQVQKDAAYEEAARQVQLADLKLKDKDREEAKAKALAELKEKLDNAELDRVIKIAEMRKHDLEQFREAAGRVYDSLVEKGATGLLDFFKGQVEVIKRTIFQNLAAELYTQLKDKMKLGSVIPGQTTTDKNGNPQLTTLGRILKGTPLGVDESKLILQTNTNETRNNTTVTKELNQTIKDLKATIEARGAAGGEAGAAGSAAGDAVGSTLDSITGGKQATKFQKTLTSALAIGAGALGVIQGARQGGVGGGLMAAGGVAAIAGTVLPLISKSLKIAGPIGEIAAIGLSMLGGLLGHSKEKFDKEQTEALNANKYTEPTASSRTTDLRNQDVDYDYQGRLRVQTSPTVINLNVNALDARSFLDRSSDVAEAVRKELKLGHPVGLDIQQAILGA